jgi:hypothetical protein
MVGRSGDDAHHQRRKKDEQHQGMACEEPDQQAVLASKTEWLVSRSASDLSLRRTRY